MCYLLWGQIKLHCIERYQCDQYEYKIRKARINHEANEGKCHLAQYRKVPEEINNEIHDVHLEPCYMIMLLGF